MENIRRLTGLIPAAYTPIYPNGKLNLNQVSLQVDYFRQVGVKTVFLSGTTGECFSFSTKERIDLLQCWLEVAGDDISIIFHVGHNCLGEAEKMAAAAATSGALAVATMAPFFFKPANIKTLVDWCTPIAAAAENLPFFFYHIPALTGVDLPMLSFLQLGAEKIPTLKGIKYTSRNMPDLNSCLHLEQGRFDILSGWDENLLGALSIGAQGAVGSTYNYAAPLYQKLIQAFNKGDIESARKYQLQSIQLIDILLEFGVMQAGKAIMAMRGVDCGPVRPPLVPLKPQKLAELKSKVKKLSFLHFD